MLRHAWPHVFLASEVILRGIASIIPDQDESTCASRLIFGPSLDSFPSGTLIPINSCTTGSRVRRGASRLEMHGASHSESELRIQSVRYRQYLGQTVRPNEAFMIYAPR